MLKRDRILIEGIAWYFSPLRYICYLPAGRSVWLKTATEGLKVLLTQTLVAIIWKVLSSQRVTFFWYTNLPFSFSVKLTKNFKSDPYRCGSSSLWPLRNKNTISSCNPKRELYFAFIQLVACTIIKKRSKGNKNSISNWSRKQSQ